MSDIQGMPPDAALIVDESYVCDVPEGCTGSFYQHCSAPTVPDEDGAYHTHCWVQCRSYCDSPPVGLPEPGSSALLAGVLLVAALGRRR